MNELVINTQEALPKRKSGPKRKEVIIPVPVEAKTIEIAPVDPKEARKRAAKEKWMRDKEHKSKMVTGKFLFNECPGGELVFEYLEFPGDRKITYKMRHDSIHTIPLGVAMHLNDRCSYPEYAHNLDAGKTIDAKNMYVTTKIHRTNFIPLDFTLDAGNYSGKSLAQVSFNNPSEENRILDSMGR